jgi:hypothetical protein
MDAVVFGLAEAKQPWFWEIAGAATAVLLLPAGAVLVPTADCAVAELAPAPLPR